jgi:hypothetical protein
MHALLVLEIGCWPRQPLEEGWLALLTPPLEQSAHRLVTHAQVTGKVRRAPALAGQQDPLDSLPLVGIYI